LNDPSIKEEGDKTIKIDTIPLKDGRRKSMLLNKVYDDDDYIYLDKLQTRGVKKSILYT
jgi:hypothetical protein